MARKTPASRCAPTCGERDIHPPPSEGAQVSRELQHSRIWSDWDYLPAAGCGASDHTSSGFLGAWVLALMSRPSDGTVASPTKISCLAVIAYARAEAANDNAAPAKHAGHADPLVA
jgi:hypothetical protein